MPIQEHIEQGEILEVKLDKSYGFAYIKYIETKEEFNLKSQARFFLVMNYHSNFSIDNINSNELKPLINYIAIGGPIPFKGKYKLKRVGIQIKNSIWDQIVYRGSRFSMDKPFDETNKWWIIENYNISMNEIKYMPFEKIKHLSTAMVGSVKTIITLLTMIWMRRLGENILDYYSNQEFKENPWLEIDYKYAKDIVFLETIPEEYWFKPLP
jgi:hypothetical protein